MLKHPTDPNYKKSFGFTNLRQSMEVFEDVTYEEDVAAQGISVEVLDVDLADVLLIDENCVDALVVVEDQLLDLYGDENHGEFLKNIHIL